MNQETEEQEECSAQEESRPVWDNMTAEEFNYIYFIEYNYIP